MLIDGKDEFVRKAVDMENKFLKLYGQPELSDTGAFMNGMNLTGVKLRYSLLYDAIIESVINHAEIVQKENGELDII